MTRWCWLAALVMLVGGCGGRGHVLTAKSAAAPPRLRNAHPCPTIAGFTCAWLTVPLDYVGQAHGTLALAVGVQNQTAAPHGVLVMLTGGPGQPACP